MKTIRALQFLVILVLLAAGLNLQAQDKESRTIKDVEKLSFSIAANLEIKQGNKEELILIGDKGDLEKITTKVEEGKLKIYQQNGFGRNTSDIKIMLTVKNLEKLSVSGSGDVKFMTDFKAEDFGLHLSGSGDIECNTLNADRLKISISGSGDIEVGGELASSLEVKISGSGDVDASELKAKAVEVNISGSGDAKVWATDVLESNISGSGSVRYNGDPKVNSMVRGSGSTKAL